ncbi:MAG TPA: hypothetical protein VJ550_15860 [Geomonas sp.]|nr:hypothetical protein [Geomonas sp.]
MKKALMLVSFTAVLALSSLPAFADTPETQTPAQKDECLLAAKNCADQVDDIYGRIHRLQKEIKKGEKAYSAAEIRALQQKLQEADKLLQDLEKAE